MDDGCENDLVRKLSVPCLRVTLPVQLVFSSRFVSYITLYFAKERPLTVKQTIAVDKYMLKSKIKGSRLIST